MRRCIVVLLLVLLPLQFSWAAVAGYCELASNSVAGHPGDHDHAAHAHDAKAGDSGAQAASEDGTSAAPDLDCGHCHGHCAAVLDVLDGLQTAVPRGAAPTLGELHHAEHTPAQPDRPQWASLA
jgi:hypothetical protein